MPDVNKHKSMRIPIVWIGSLVLLLTTAFVTPAQAQDAPSDSPVLNTPVDQDSILVTTPAVALAWDVVDRAATHEVQLFYSEPVDGMEPIPLKTKVLSNASQELDVAELLGFVTASGSDGDSTFHWRVRGRNANGEGPWSEVWEFTLVEEDNSPPEIENPGPQSVDELTTLLLDINATSPSGSALTYALDQASLDAGMVIDPVTGELTWTPTEEQGPGAYDVTLTVTDEEGRSTMATFTITVNEVNLPPELAAIADTTAEIGTELAITAVATDPDIPENTLTYSLDQASLDLGMVIDPVTGEITWTPTADQEMMSYDVTVTATDDGDPVASDSQTFTVTVGDAGGPVIDPLDAQTIDELTTLLLDIDATSPSGSALTYALDQASLDAGMVIDPVTGELTWTPTEEQGPGAYDVTLTVTDEEGRSTMATFTITVNEVNLPPELAAIADTTAEIGTELAITAVATDPDIPENTLTYSLDQASLDLGMVIDSVTGEITWTPTADQEMMSYDVTVTATDDGDPVASDSQTFTVTVGDAGGPVIDPLDAQTIDELTTLLLDIDATSPSGSVLTYALDQASLDAGMVIDPVTGELTWTPTEEQGPGAYDVTLTVTDEEGRSTMATFTITVNEVNLPPELAAIADTTAEIGTELAITAAATDPDIPENTLTYSLNQASLDLGMVIDPLTGEITWTPADGQALDTYTVTVTVTDDGDPAASDSETFTVVLGDIEPPVIDTIADQSIDELVELAFTVTATDPNDSPLTYSLDQASLDAGMVIDPATGDVTWTPTEEQGPGSYDVTVSVVNAEGLSDTESFTITVNEVNLPPVLEVIADQTVLKEQTVSVQAVATDPDIPANTLIYSLDQASLDLGMTIVSGLISWTPDATVAVGAYPVTVTVMDNGSPMASDSQTFTINVDDIPTPPVSTLITQPFCSAAADFDLEWSVNGPGQFDGFVVQIATDIGFTNIVDELSTGTATAKAPLANLDFGTTYYWRVITVLGDQQSAPSLSTAFSRWRSDIQVAHTLAYAKATETNDFRMISVPGQSGSIPIASTFSGMQAPDGPLRPNGSWDWSVWRDNSANADYPGYLNQSISDTPFAPGVGYWAISTSAWEVPAQMIANAPLANDRLFPIPLEQGSGDNDLRWTMIGNPFDFSVLWQDLIDENELTQSFDLWDWTGTRYESVTILEPYKGYYYFNSKNDPTLEIPCILTPVNTATEKEEDVTGVTLAISLHEDKLADTALSSVTIRSHEEASEDFDRFDRTVPPAYFEKHRVTLVNKDMAVDYPYLIEEARQSFAESQVFNLELKTQANEPAYLRIDGLEALADQEVYLFDDVLGRSFNLHEDPIVLIEPDQEISQLRLLVGDADFIAAEEALLIPDDFKMMQSYPNPFVDQTTIEFTLPDPEFVTLEIYNILGQRVRTLVHGDKDAGYHRVTWDGTSQTGEVVASGMYLYVFKSPSHHATERLVRVR